MEDARDHEHRMQEVSGQVWFPERGDSGLPDGRGMRTFTREEKGNGVMKRGKFIVLEGLDGAGTTSMSEEIAGHFQSRDKPMEISQEPYSSELSATLRKFISGYYADPGWRPMSLLFSADRLMHCKDLSTILAGGMNVVCDRYLGSTAAYQSAMAPEDEVDEAFWFITGPLSSGVLVPDLTLYLKADVEVCVQRREKDRTTEDYYERLEFQHKVAVAYDRWAQFEAERQDRKLLVVVDANQEYAAVKRDCLLASELVF